MSKVIANNLATRDGVVDLEVKHLLVRDSAMENLGEYKQGIELKTIQQYFMKDGIKFTGKAFQLPLVLSGDWEVDSVYVETYGDQWDHSKLFNKDAPNAHDASAIGFKQKGEGAASLNILVKNQQWLHSEDYNFNPDSGDVTEEGLRLFAAAKEKRRPIILGAGDFYISGSLDIAGLDVRGTRGGWKNQGGTRFFGDGSHHIFEQKTPMGQNLNFSIRDIYVSGGLSAIYSRYGIFANVSDFFAENVTKGIHLGTSESYGPLWCSMERVRIDSLEEALLLDGSAVANANKFDTCFFKGGFKVDDVNDFVPAVRVRASGGYGALGNTFINTEFTGEGVGVSVTSGGGNTFIGCYHEARGPQYHFSGAPRSVKIIGGVHARSSNEHASPPCFIWHQKDTVRLSLDGGQVFLSETDPAQSNMSFFESQSLSGFNLDLLSIPSITSRPTDFRIFGGGLPTQRVNALNYGNSFDSELTSSFGGNPNIGGGSVDANYNISGGTCTVSINAVFGSGLEARGQGWYFTPPPNLRPLVRSIGSARIQRGSEYRSVTVFAWQGALSLTDDLTSQALGGSSPWEWQEGDRILLTVVYPIS